MVREFIEGWDLIQVLGEGTFGEVNLIVNRANGEACAVKERANIFFLNNEQKILESKNYGMYHNRNGQNPKTMEQFCEILIILKFL